LGKSITFQELTCHDPLFLFNAFGDLERVLLRRGNRGSAKYCRRVLPVIERYRVLDMPKLFRRDAACAGPKLLRSRERAGFRHATRDGAPLFWGNAL
jgi:hypothetical protein